MDSAKEKEGVLGFFLNVSDRWENSVPHVFQLASRFDSASAESEEANWRIIKYTHMRAHTHTHTQNQHSARQPR